LQGKEDLLAASDDPRGVIIISAHLGNWEMAHIFGSCFLRSPLVLVARPVRPGFVNRWLNRFRSRFGNILLDKDRALPKMARALSRGGRVGILIDQGTLRSEGVEIQFFNRTTTATPVAAILARRFGSRVLPAFCVRDSVGTLTLLVRPPLNLQKTGDMETDIHANTQIMNRAIEDAVDAYPEQWFWFHKRWKRHYPHLYPEDLTRRKNQKLKRKRLHAAHNMNPAG